MTDDLSPAAGDAAAWAVLEEAEEHYRRMIRALNDLIEEIQAGNSERARMLRGALNDLGKAAQTAFDERQRVERRLNAESGSDGGIQALDLDHARLEVRRRLDRLRSARDADSVSGGDG
ncbi:hypothetical protein NHU_02766 [Rhodovulum sulfidophilum]|uniref:Permease n=1 Tax=Rhodovulum sulfidophilum TaxID=35806 RepID=A0A0D6B451_RHOSU|nr:hypothetical protein NHU_02766 [Rhodovulum sulfidophilum]